MTEFEIAAYVDRVLRGTELDRVEAHLADCRECRRELAEVTALRQSHRRRRLVPYVPLVAAATIALAFLIRNSGAPGPQSEFRDPTLTLAAPPTLIAPLGESEQPGTLIWSAVPRVSLYRITIFDVEGERVWEHQVADTVVQLPESISLTPGADYFWKVSAQLDRDRWVSSELSVFNPSDSRPDR